MKDKQVAGVGFLGFDREDMGKGITVTPLRCILWAWGYGQGTWTKTPDWTATELRNDTH